MELKLDQKKLVYGAASVFAGYIFYTWTGGEALPILKQFTPWVAGIVAGLALWKHLTK